MKAIMVLFDSLNRRMLSPYGCDWVHTPNFQRLAERCVTFDNSYVGSMPCMPARREIHTGRYNFLHCGWGIHEAFDDSMPEILKQHGIYTHLVSDHYHYWEDGGCTYHTKYNTWEYARGQEGDPWIGQVRDPNIPNHINKKGRRQDWVNRPYMEPEEKHPQAQTFAMGLDFLRRNHREDNWFLTIESFDPHEPYCVPQRFTELYPHEYDGPLFDWPGYCGVTETPEQVQHLRYSNAALVSMCDEYLGRVLDFMNTHAMWEDTLLIVNTDHGFLLGEHGLWAKNYPPSYDEIAHIPLFVWDPRCRVQGERRQSLVQTIDLPPTLLDFFAVPIPEDMQGKPLAATLASDTPVREAGLFGTFGHQINVTDGRYVYMRSPAYPENQPLNRYTQSTTMLRRQITNHQSVPFELAGPFSFSKGSQLLKMPFEAGELTLPTMLFDLSTDPGQEQPIDDPDVEQRMMNHMVRLMQENDAPPEQFVRMGLPATVSQNHHPAHA